MKKIISEMAKMSGVSVRTLHYYDEIGLLKPSEVISETGYRYYDENSLMKLQQILFYRELDFQLKDIARILNAPDYNKNEALIKQRELLKLKRRRLDKLIGLLDANLKGDKEMSFKEFETKEFNAAKEKYAAEVEERWGSTKAYTQSKEKTGKYSEGKWKEVMGQMDELLRDFANHLGDSPEDEAVQSLVGQWQQHITDNYYDCTKEILAGLGEMYVADERFCKNMDKFGEGTSKLISQAIQIYCSRK